MIVAPPAGKNIQYPDRLFDQKNFLRLSRETVHEGLT